MIQKDTLSNFRSNEFSLFLNLLYVNTVLVYLIFLLFPLIKEI